ncbi:exopolyphosphatase [Escherichia coli]|nr:exopolyphosphatase [Escherichia coli]
MPIHDKSPRPQELPAVDLGFKQFSHGHSPCGRWCHADYWSPETAGASGGRPGPDNMLSEEAMTRRFKLVCRCLPNGYKVFSCQRLYSWYPTLRQALNATDFLKRAEKVIPYRLKLFPVMKKPV